MPAGLMSGVGPTSAGARLAVSDAPALIFRRHARARRYLLRLNRDGHVVVTIPRGGSQRAALAFVERSRTWIDREQRRRASAAGHAPCWGGGMRLWFRGTQVVLTVDRAHGRPFVSFGDQRVWLADERVNLRRPVEQRLRQLAADELPARTRELAVQHRVEIRAVSVRDQTSRWGSCSDRGVISLNWRLVQAPAAVRDYLIVHELMHRPEMNHSLRFWRLVAAAFPAWREAEAWLDTHAFELGF